MEVSGPLLSTIDLTGPLARSTWNLPTPVFDRIRVKAKRSIHAGVIGTQVSIVAAGNVTCSELAGTADDWTGRDLSIIADESDGSAPIWNFRCTSYNSTAGEFTVTPDPISAGVETGDVLIVRAMPPGVCSEYTISDPGFANGLYPSGMTPGAEEGSLVRIIAGAGRGQVRRIVSNDATSLTTDKAWDVLPDATSRFIIEAPAWEYWGESTPTKNALKDVQTTVRLIADNMLDQTMLVAGFGVDKTGLESPESMSPLREVYMFGDLGNLGIADAYAELPGADTITPDLTSGANQEFLLDRALTFITTPLNADLSRKLTVALRQDAAGNRRVSWHSDYLIPEGADISTTANTKSVFSFLRQPDGRWLLRYWPVTGVPA